MNNYCSLRASIFVVFLVSFISVSAQNDKAATNDIVTPQQLALLIGDWEGTLTYLNYSDNTEVSIKAKLKAAEGENETQLAMTNIYPDEPGHGGSYTLSITKNGSRLNKSRIVSSKQLADGTTEIMTIRKGRDDGKRSRIRITYLIAPKDLVVRKEVLFKGATEWLKRNQYTYTRT